jgi:3-methylfumaryl-CoA hydratase
MTPLDIDHLRTWIGREETAEETVTAALVQRFRATFDEEPGTPVEGEAAPRFIHLCLAPPLALTRALGPDGHPARGGFLPPVPLPRRMWAGGALTFTDELRVGDTMRRTSRVENLTVKEGRTGTLCFVTVLHTITADARAILTERHDIVYRGLDARGGGAPTPPAAAQGRFQDAVDPSPALLFRYSALTFNGHRIHYDQPYVTRQEGYPGLVVHGPLQATLLYRFATRILGRPPARFAFRGLSPVFDTAPLLLHADEAGPGALKLWTAAPGGPEAMVAQAHG